MYKILSLVLLLTLPLTVKAQENIKIESLEAYPDNDETALPVISGGKLTIEFDLNADNVPQLSVVFRFCDKNWNPTGNLFLANNGYNTYTNLDFSTLPGTVKKARYHFKESFPDNKGMVSFPFSGKWMYFITDTYDTSKVFAKGKFVYVQGPIRNECNAEKRKA